MALNNTEWGLIGSSGGFALLALVGIIGYVMTRSGNSEILSNSAIQNAHKVSSSGSRKSMGSSDLSSMISSVAFGRAATKRRKGKKGKKGKSHKKR